MKKTIITLLILCLEMAVPSGLAAQEKKTLPQGMTQEQYDAISAQLPKGVTLEMVIANLPEGMTLQQALKIMAEQQKAKQETAQTPKGGETAAATTTEDDNWKKTRFIPYAGLNLGMTTSIGTPAETRTVEASDYNFNYVIGCLVTQRFTKKFGLATGLRFERKGSNSNVRMKDYYTLVHFKGETNGGTQGYFSGRSQGFHDVYYLTVPVGFMYQPNPKWEMHFGPYFSYAVWKDRHGITSEGNIRQTLLSPAIPVDYSTADNSDKVYDFDWGLEYGVTRQMYRNLYLVFDFSWGLKNVWDGSEYGMKKNIYNIYAQLGFGWRF